MNVQFLRFGYLLDKHVRISSLGFITLMRPEHLRPYFVCARSEGLGEGVLLRKLARAFAAQYLNHVNVRL